MDIFNVGVIVFLYLLSFCLGISVCLMITTSNVVGNVPVWVRRTLLITTILGGGTGVGVVFSIMLVKYIWKR